MAVYRPATRHADGRDVFHFSQDHRLRTGRTPTYRQGFNRCGLAYCHFLSVLRLGLGDEVCNACSKGEVVEVQQALTDSSDSFLFGCLVVHVA